MRFAIVLVADHRQPGDRLDQVGHAADVVRMVVGGPDRDQPDAGLAGRGQDRRGLAGIDDGGVAVIDDQVGIVVLEARHRDDRHAPRLPRMYGPAHVRDHGSGGPPRARRTRGALAARRCRGPSPGPARSGSRSRRSRSTTSTSGSAAAARRSSSSTRTGSAPTSPARSTRSAPGVTGLVAGARVVVQPGPVVRPVRGLPRRPRQPVPPLQDHRREQPGRLRRVHRGAAGQHRAGAARAVRYRRGRGAAAVPDRVADDRPQGAGRARRRRPGPGRRRRGRGRGPANRQAPRRPRDRDGRLRRQGRAGAASWAPTTSSTTAPPTSSPRPAS